MEFEILYYYDFWNDREKTQLYDQLFHTGYTWKGLLVGERLHIMNNKIFIKEKSMIRDNYKIIKSDIKAGCTYYGSRYELRVWFEGIDLKEMGCIEYLPMYYLKDMGIVKRGYSFKKAQEFLDSDKGKEWLSKHFKDRDYEHEKDEMETKIKRKLWSMDFETMIKADKLLEELVNNKNENQSIIE